MRRALVIFFAACLAVPLEAQILGDSPHTASVGVDLASRVRRAELHYQFFSYRSSVDLYHQVINKKGGNDTLRLRVAECYRKLNWQDSAASWYGQIKDESVMDPIHHLYYAQALQYTGDYDQAKNQYQRYQELVVGDSRASLNISAIDNRDDYYIDSALYRVTELPINSPEADFAPAYYRNGFVFASSRERPALIQKKFKWNQKPYLDLYYAERLDSANYAKPVGLSKKVNSKFHEGPVATYDGGRKMIFTRNNFLQGTGKSEEGIIKLKLYSAEISEDRKWTKVQELPFNSDEYSVGHPTMSEDGKTLYFASDMPGGYGGTDIWVSTYDSAWSQPVNLGDQINSEGNELFPFIHGDSLLYFASNGYGGLGGLDIYKTWVHAEDPGVVNLGYPVNTNKDDFALVLDLPGKKGFLSSNREGGTGDDDIYSLVLNRIVVDAYLVDKQTGEPILGGNLFALDRSTDRPVPVLKEGNHIHYDALPNREYAIKGSKEGYLDNTVILPIGRLQGEDRIKVKVELERIAPVDLLVIENISGKRQNFILGDSITLFDGSEEEMQQSLAAQYIPVGQVIRISNIYFDLDKSFIRDDATVQLDRMVELLNKYPQMTLALDSHADSRASDPYNDALSNRRVKATSSYLVDHGIDPHRISQAYFGERNLVNNCGNDALCTEAQHQFNRRTEFELTKY
jgi:outer membrane protein OmpA-like peptidoglycan-associated protein/tetratricopeptide (TPR) repeat protein